MFYVDGKSLEEKRVLHFFLYNTNLPSRLLSDSLLCAIRWLQQVSLPSNFYFGSACGVGQRSGVEGMEEEITVN